MSFFTDQSCSGVENTIVYLVSFCEQEKSITKGESRKLCIQVNLTLIPQKNSEINNKTDHLEVLN